MLSLRNVNCWKKHANVSAQYFESRHLRDELQRILRIEELSVKAQCFVLKYAKWTTHLEISPRSG